MNNEEFNKGQFIANWNQLDADNISFFVPASHYNVSKDKRLLIPFKKNHKIGFVNRQAEYVVDAKYDIVYGDAYNENSLIKVGVRYVFSRQYQVGGRIYTYDTHKWGVIDDAGHTVIEPTYSGISISDDKKLFSVKDFKKGSGVVTRDGKIIVPFGIYNFIDGFTKGFARVQKNGRWGIIDTQGNIALPAEYDAIWTFHEKSNLFSTKVFKDGIEKQFLFSSGKLKEKSKMNTHYSPYDSNDSHYGEYAGTYAQDVAGYSDDVINDAFDGEPEAYWNID